jgi:isoamyl acetate esterase
MTGLYARQCLEVAQEMQLPWIDLWFAMQQISGWQKLFL